MKIHLFPSIITCYIFLGFISCIDVSMAVDSLSNSQSVTVNESLISSQEKFQLGFFNPGNSSKFYLAIWFRNIPTKTTVWIANRDNPLNDSSSALRIGNDGNLILVDETERTIWSTNITGLSSNNTSVKLFDSGNLVLRDGDEGNVIWESFDHPSHAIVPGMKLGWDLRTGLNRKLTSWKSSNDPSPGEYTYGFDLRGLPQAFMWKGSAIMFRSLPWNGKDYGGVVFDRNFSFTSEAIVNPEEVYYRISPKNNSLIMLDLSYMGVVEYHLWEYSSNSWRLMLTIPQDICGRYEICGPNSYCTLINALRDCTCFLGYSPRNSQEWNLQLFSGGCVRNSPLNCSEGEGFSEVTSIKLPDFLQFWLNPNISLEECKAECLKNCSCTACANSDTTRSGHGCILWFGDLVDVRKISNYDSQKLYIRVTASDLEAESKSTNEKKLVVILVITITTASILLLLAVLFLIWKRKSSKKSRQQGSHLTGEENLELPYFDMGTIAKATQNFSNINKIGEGGFGPVYKGFLSNGQLIAVKRLSKKSFQGFDEYKNEVMVIAKLQHRNLVRLLGCCIQEDERILIYEYMSNGSLDSYIFGGLNFNEKHLLAWRRRFSIIVGIARGLLYLHRDSRLRIIHRDLKASNVLLDLEMNPKISDFGTARAFGEEQSMTKTRRVVGTYGYMAPEYASRGIISMKSDVFSFGVLVLEIVSGKRNSRFHHPEHDLNLLGHAWKLWIQEKAYDLIDPSMEDSFPISEVMRCIQVGLLCVQQRPEERPVMSTVLLMLDSETVMLSQPNRPGFYTENCLYDENVDLLSRRLLTINDLSETIIEGR